MLTKLINIKANKYKVDKYKIVARGKVSEHRHRSAQSVLGTIIS